MKKTVDESRRSRRTSRILLVCLWLLLLAAWILFGSKAFLALFLTLTVLTPLSLLLPYAAVKRIGVSVQTPALPVQTNQSFDIKVMLKNAAVLPLHGCELIVNCRNTYTDACEPLVLPADLAPKGRAEISFAMQSAHCGYFQTEITGVRVFDLFGAFSRVYSLPQPVSAGTPVFPDVYSVTVAVSPSVAEGFAQSDRLTEQKGTDLSQSVRLRPFEPGDTLRQVHWKLSEKTGEWITREGAADGKESLLLFWDPSGSGREPALADALASAVASVCYALIDEGVSFRFAWTLSEEAAFAEPVTDSLVSTRILEAVRRQTEEREIPDTLSDGSRVLFFSIHRPAAASETVTYIHCDDGCPSPEQPLLELIV